MIGKELIDFIRKNGLENRHFFIDVEGYVSPIQTTFENKRGDIFLSQEGRNENDYLDDYNNRSRYFEEWFNIISYTEAQMLWANGNRGFVVLRSDGSDCYADCYDNFKDIPRDSYFGTEKEVVTTCKQAGNTFDERIQNVIDCLKYWEGRVGEYVMELEECTESDDECKMEDTQRALEFIRNLPEIIAASETIRIVPECLRFDGGYLYFHVASGGYITNGQFCVYDPGFHSEMSIIGITENENIPYELIEKNWDRFEKELKEISADKYKELVRQETEKNAEQEEGKKVYFLKDISEDSVDAVIIAKTSSEEDITNAIIQAKQNDEYQWDDIIKALPDDCEVYDTWSVKKVYY